MEAEATNTLAQYGILGIAVLVFGYTIVILFRRSDARDKEHAAERAAAIAREQTLRVEHVAQLRGILEDHAKNLREVRELAQQREDLIRREFSELMENVADKVEGSSKTQAEVMNKILERFISPRIIK